VVRNFRYQDSPGVALSGAPQTAAEVDWLREQGIGAVCSLHPVPMEVAEALRDRGMAHLEFPVRDFSEPLPGDLQILARFVAENSGSGVLIH
jgi:hypothetical protein